MQEIQIASFVNPKRVPGWADAEEVVSGVKMRGGVRYTGLWLNEKGLMRALDAKGLTLKGSISNVTSEAFMIRNTNRDKAQNRTVQINQIETYKKHGIPMYRGGVMAAFGCNFEGEIPVSRVLETIEEIKEQNRDIFLEAGGEQFGYVKALNASWSHAKALTDILRQKLDKPD